MAEPMYVAPALSDVGFVGVPFDDFKPRIDKVVAEVRAPIVMTRPAFLRKYIRVCPMQCRVTVPTRAALSALLGLICESCPVTVHATLRRTLEFLTIFHCLARPLSSCVG